MVLKFKGAFQGKRTMQAFIIMMLALFMGPQKAYAGIDLKDYRLFYGMGFNYDDNKLHFSMEVKNVYGSDEGFYEQYGGLGIYVSKDNGQNWQQLLNLRCGDGEGISTVNGWNCWQSEQHRGHDGNNSIVSEVCFYVPLDWRNCNLKFKCQGNWSEKNGKNMTWIYKEVDYSIYYTFEVRSLYWNGDYTLDPDGTINIPYRTGSAKNTDDHTLLYAFIDGSYRYEIGDKPINLNGGIYSFKLQDIGMDMLSTFTVQPYNMYSHHNDMWGGTQYTLKTADKRTFYPLPYATNLSGAFDQLNNEISLTWNISNTDHYDGHWAIYRNGQRVGAVDQNESSYTDSGFENGNVEYQVFYELSNWPEGTQIDLLKSNVTSINAKRSIPVLNANAESQSDRIVFTWNSDGYPQDWGNKFNIYVDDETTPIITIIPTDNQTEFKWEHRSTDKHGQRETTQIDGTNYYYTEEPLNACTPHDYRIEGVIGSSTLSSVTIQKKAVGDGTLFYSFDATKGTYPDKVRLSWHVDLNGSKTAKTYYIERKRAEDDQDQWSEIYRTSSTEDYLLYTDDTPLSGVYYEYRVTVIDKCEDGEEKTNYIENIGFSQTSGTVSGRITYGTTGSAVSGADVIVKKLSTDPVSDQFYALHFTSTLGEAAWLYTDGNYADKTFADNDFTVQTWICPDELSDSKIIQFKGDDCYIGITAQGKVTFNGIVFDNVTINAKSYSHLSIIRKGTDVTCHVIYIDPKQGITTYHDSITLPSATLSLSSATQLAIGHFKGYLDEFRLWTKALSIDEIEENYDHLLVGNEKGLETYWTFDENLRAQFFDYSRNGTVYHQHHGITRTNTEPSTITPKKLELKARTDVDGNYIIQGIPFMGEGTTYEIIPSLGIHTFSPSKQLRYVSSNSLVHNATDFTDDSSFPVSGTIRYSHTDYPVEGVLFFVDGQICAKDGQPVTTNANGQFEISVPIGKHCITVQKEGHTFEYNGRFPADPNNTGELAEFFDARKNLEFWDNTLVTIAGRITGGFIENQKPLGFGKSRNNIGQATIELEAANSMNMVKMSSGLVSEYRPNEDSELEVKSPTEAVNSTAWRNKGNIDQTKIITIKTDPVTGEFAALLPPVDYLVKSVRIESNPTLDLGTFSNIIASDPNDIKTDTLVTEGGEQYFEYVAKMVKSYYADPILEVTQVNAEGAFGEKVYEYNDKTTQETVPLYSKDGDNIDYTFGYPVFKQANKYRFDVYGYELYTNYDSTDPVTDKVPLQNVEVVFSNQMGTGQEVVIDSDLTPEDDRNGDLRSTIPDVITLDDKGYSQYEWQAGLPNITSPHTLYLGATFTHVDKTYVWNGFEGIVTGALPSGNNFVTVGPDHVTMIIRDPGGTGSSAYMEKGMTRTTTLTTDVSVAYNREDMTHTEIGFKLIQFNGVGVGAISGIITDNSELSTVDAGFTIEDSYENSTTRTLTTSTTRRISTSAEPEYVGAMGDVFIGKSTNLVFGNARSVALVKKNGHYGFEAKDDYVTDQSFRTEFAYSQNYIINTLIPNIINLRNDVLRKGVDEYGSTYTVHPDVHEDDDNYGTEGTYDYTPVSPLPKFKAVSDQVRIYNQMIKNWEKQLSSNEEAKVKAIKERDTYIARNESFDTGSSIESSVTNTNGNTTSNSYSFSTEVSVEMGTDIEILSIEMNYSTKHSISSTTSITDETETESSVTTGYTLAEVGDDDALTIDVFNAPDGNGAIFVTRGGQTSGPYEGEQKTLYYEPGKHVISAATMQIEIPRISVENAANRVGSIPAGKTATYMLLLRNDSETREDCFFDLFSIDETNSKGAGLHVNGNELGNGRSVLVPAGGTVRMRLDLEQNSLGDLRYDSIAIVLASQSQSDPTSTWDVIADTVWISAEFVPTSTDVTLRIDNTTVNTSTRGELQLSVRDFDPHYDGLKYIAIQYQGTGETTWRDVRKYYVDSKDITDNDNEEVLPTSGMINYTLNMNSSLFTDRTYKFRALSARAYGNGEVTCVSDEITVIKDMRRPMALGNPQPSDGILSAGDELSILFNEDIQSGRVTESNFLITGILNGSKINHQTALALNNTTLAASDADINLIDKDFTFEFFIKPDGAGTILSHGTGTKKMEVGINRDGKLTVTIEGQTYTSGNSVPLGEWDYMSISYDAREHLLNAQLSDVYMNTVILFFNLEVPRYMGNGPICIGRNMSGAMHELLLWEQVRNMSETQNQSLLSKDPHSRNLIGYWKMNEGEGRTVTDYSRNRHMTMEAENWYFENKNKAVVLDGAQYMSISTSDIGISMDNDYAVEMWVKAPAQTGQAQLLQAGQVALYIDENGKLQMTSNGTDISVQDILLADNAWHHVALSIIRNGNANIYVDGINRLSVGADKVASTSGDNLFIGVRRTHQDSYPEYVFDRYLTATIDEVRIWHATMSADLIKRQRNMRLTGTEPGLVAYYPFERNTLDETSNQPVTVTDDTDIHRAGHPALINGQSIDASQFTDETPALHVKPEMENVLFNFITSDNKIVINITEQMAKIEGTTLNITVRDVSDLNGNLSNSVTWTAYVDMNPLKWENRELEITQNVTRQSTLNATLVNKSGQQQTWSLSNLPSWLDADIEYGVLMPQSEQTITFTVSPATPIGKYEQTIYVQGNDGINTPLVLNVNVIGNIPDWSVNPYDYESSMNLIGILIKDNTYMADPDNIIAAFIGEECRGVAQPVYNERYGNYYVTMDIYGSSTDIGNEVTFRAYDALSGTIYPEVTWNSGKLTFTPLTLAGTYADPLIFTVQDKIEQVTELKAGWNWISINVKAQDMSVPAIFKNIADNVVAIKSQTGGYKVYEDDMWTGNLGNLSNDEMYAVQVKSDCKLRVVGTVPTAPVTVKPGWNWIGYYGRRVATLADALADLDKTDGDMVKAQQGIAYWDNYEWSGSLIMLQPGMGYQIMSTALLDKTFSYPSTIVNATHLAPRRDISLSQSYDGVFNPVNVRAYPDNAIMAVKITAGNRPLANTEVGIFAGDECRTAAFTGNDGVALLTIPGDDPCLITLKAAIGDQIIESPVTLLYQTNAMFGTPNHPILMDMRTTGIDAVSKGSDIGTVYDLGGRKVESEIPDRKGIYIINGQKQAVK